MTRANAGYTEEAEQGESWILDAVLAAIEEARRLLNPAE